MVRSWDVAGDLPPIDARALLTAERTELVRFLGALDGDAWQAPTACPGWSIHDVALHLLGNDFGRLQAERRPDRGSRRAPEDYGALASSIEQANEAWVRATRRIPARVVPDLLSFTGPRVDRLFASLDPMSPALPVAWTGTGPSPSWLDVAREYTERWVHQTQIREAAGGAGLVGRAWLHPVLDTFMRCLPRAYAAIAAPRDSAVRITVTGEAGGAWAVRREPDRWRLLADPPGPVAAEVVVPADVAWRLLSRTIDMDAALRSMAMAGEERLAAAVTRATAIMTTRL